MKQIGYFSTTILVAIYASILNGWGLSKLWAWFIVPVFELRPLTISMAIGLSLVVTYFTFHPDTKKDERKYSEQLAWSFTLVTMKVFISLLIGVVVKQFIRP